MTTKHVCSFRSWSGDCIPLYEHVKIELGVGISSYLLGIPFRESAVIVVLMNTRGLVELIVLNIGLNQGILNQRVFQSWLLCAYSRQSDMIILICDIDYHHHITNTIVFYAMYHWNLLLMMRISIG